MSIKTMNPFNSHLMNSNSRKAVWALAVLLLASCSPNTPEPANEQVREVVVEAMMVRPENFSEYVRVTGKVEALEDAIISAEVPGRVHYIAERGTFAEEGSVLVRLDDRMVQSSLEMARANFEFAEDAFRRQQPLLQDSIISALEFQQARTLRDQARSQLDQAEKQLSDSRIQAPFAGRVEERMVRSGELVNPGFPVLRLVNTRQVRIHSGVPERYINDIVKGTAVTVHLDAYGGDILKTEVHFAGNMIIPETRTFPVELLVQNGNGLLKPEMAVRLEITRNVWENALIVPRTALVRDEEGLQIYVARQQGETWNAEARRVRTGAASGNLIVIEEGIESGDKVIVIGQSNVSDGDRIQIRARRTLDEYR